MHSKRFRLFIEQMEQFDALRAELALSNANRARMEAKLAMIEQQGNAMMEQQQAMMEQVKEFPALISKAMEKQNEDNKAWWEKQNEERKKTEMKLKIVKELLDTQFNDQFKIKQDC